MNINESTKILGNEYNETVVKYNLLQLVAKREEEINAK